MKSNYIELDIKLIEEAIQTLGDNKKFKTLFMFERLWSIIGECHSERQMALLTQYKDVQRKPCMTVDDTIDRLEFLSDRSYQIITAYIALEDDDDFNDLKEQFKNLIARLYQEINEYNHLEIITLLHGIKNTDKDFFLKIKNLYKKD